MKKILSLLFVLTMPLGLAACGGSAAKADYNSPKAVIEAHEAINTEWKNNGIYTDLEGKTFKIKTTATLDKSEPFGDTGKAKKADKDSRPWVCVPYSDIETDVMLWLTNEEWEKLNYKKGDTMVLEIDDIMVRGTKNGGLRQYYINAAPAD